MSDKCTAAVVFDTVIPALDNADSTHSEVVEMRDATATGFVVNGMNRDLGFRLFIALGMIEGAPSGVERTLEFGVIEIVQIGPVLVRKV